jgi:predicted MFS family arabinose efflux permease
MFAHLVRARDRAAAGAKPQSTFRELLSLIRVDTALALTTTFFVMAAGFILVPNISAYLLGNVGYARKDLGLLYLAGGSVSFFSMRLVGRLVDKLGSARVGTIGTIAVSIVVYLGFVLFPPAIPVMAIFIGFMIAMAFRNVAYNTLVSRVPNADERARFGSLQSAVQHFAASAAAFTSAQLLTELPNKTLSGIPTVAVASIAISLSLIPLFFIVERRVRGRITAAAKKA